MVRMGTVAERIDAWIRYEHTSWDLDVDSLLAWASPSGDDLGAAWDACPRGDHLMALAGALGLPFVFVVRPLCAVARDALRVIPSREHEARQLVTQWERWRPPQKAREPLPDSDAHRAVWKRIDAWHVEVEREQLLLAATADRFTAGVTRVIGDSFDAFEERIRRGVVDAANDPMGRQVEDVLSALRSFIASDRDALMWRSAVPGPRRSLGVGHAMRAVGSLSVAVASGDQMMCAMESARAFGASLSEDQRDAVMRLAERGSQRVFSEGAMVMRHAAKALGVDRALKPDGVEASLTVGLQSFEAQLRASVADAPSPAPKMVHAINESLDALADAYEEEAALSQAKLLRASIPRAEVLRAADRESIFWSQSGPSLAESMGLMRPPRAS